MDAAVGRHRAMLVAVGMLAIAVLAGAVLLWPHGEGNRPAAAGQRDPTRLVNATLTRVQPLECEEADPGGTQLHLHQGRGAVGRRQAARCRMEIKQRREVQADADPLGQAAAVGLTAPM
jgi:hypothetical protein